MERDHAEAKQNCPAKLLRREISCGVSSDMVCWTGRKLEKQRLGEGMGSMKHPGPWCDTIDPFTLPYRSFKPLEILGYPHAGNDVFYVRRLYHGRQINAYIKAARQRGADIGNEISILSQLRSLVTPPVVDFCLDGTTFIVTQALPGEHLSMIMGENAALESLSYLEEYGAASARIHQLNIQAERVKDRKFFHTPPDAVLEALEFENLKGFFSIRRGTCQHVFLPWGFPLCEYPLGGAPDQRHSGF